MHVTIGAGNKVTREEKPPRTRLGILVIIPSLDARLEAVAYLENQLSRHLGYTRRAGSTRAEDRYAAAGPQAIEALRDHTWDHVVVMRYLEWPSVTEVWNRIEDARLFDKSQVHWADLYDHVGDR